MVYETMCWEDTFNLGKKIGQQAKPGQVICLNGDLGVGKTVFTQGFAKGLGIEETVNSPTFTIVKEYHSGRLPLYHFDVYRVQDPDELFNIGADEYFDGNGLCVVEWADMIKEELPPDSLYVYIEYGDKEGERVYKCTF